jgi:tRNA A-37 threonylcarbamoyl transferase component Bud32
MNVFFAMPHLLSCRLKLNMHLWKDHRLVLSNGDSRGDIEPFLDSLASGRQRKNHLLKKGKNHRVTMETDASGKSVVKLYTPRKGPSNLLHALLPSKAFMEYCMTHQLFSLGIPVPQPIAAVERRWFPGNGRSLLILEYLEGCERVSRVFPLISGNERKAFLKRLACFTKRLHSTCFCHADLWARNILVRENKRDFFIIDMDGGYFSCKLLPFRAPVNLAQLLFSLNRASTLSNEEVKLFMNSYRVDSRTGERILKAYQRKFGPWPWRGDKV